MRFLEPDQARLLIGDPVAAPSPFADAPYLLIDLRGARGADAARLAREIAMLPCPVIGIGPALGAATSNDALAAACDLTLDKPEAAEPLIANISRWPLASAVLVQTLRAVAQLPLAAALDVESLAYASLQQGAEFRRWRSAFMPPAAVAAQAGPAVEITRDNDAVHLQLNRPLSGNAMTVEMRDALVQALQWLRIDDSVRELRISARGRCFSTGGDLAEFGTAPDPATAHAVRSVALPGRELARCQTASVVELQGACIGSGVEFPAFSARLHAHADAFFQLPELRYGLIPGAGGCVSVSRRIGRQRTAWMVLSGRRINARLARQWGLVDHLIEQAPDAAMS